MKENNEWYYTGNPKTKYEVKIKESASDDYRNKLKWNHLNKGNKIKSTDVKEFACARLFDNKILNSSGI